MTAAVGAIAAIAEGKPPELAAVAQRLAEIIEDSDHEFDSAAKWGALTFALEGDFHHWICSLGVTKKTANLTFHDGSILEDPQARFIAGSSKLLRKLEYVDTEGVNPDEVLAFIEQAVGRYPWFREHWRELT